MGLTVGPLPVWVDYPRVSTEPTFCIKFFLKAKPKLYVPYQYRTDKNREQVPIEKIAAS
jgi:hypothetical protein